jgi:hypothetical protein
MQGKSAKPKKSIYNSHLMRKLINFLVKNEGKYNNKFQADVTFTGVCALYMRGGDDSVLKQRDCR